MCMAEAGITDAAAAGPSTGPPATVEDCLMGRPRVEVELDDVEFLCSLKLSLTKVASLLGVSRSTIYRRMTTPRTTLRYEISLSIYYGAKYSLRSTTVRNIVIYYGAKYPLRSTTVRNIVI